MKTPTHLHRPRDFDHVATGLSDEIFAALAAGPAHIRMIAAMIGRDYQSLAGTLKWMRDSGRIVSIGRAGDHGYTDVRRDAPLYSRPGSVLPKVQAVVPVVVRPLVNVALPRRPEPVQPMKFDMLSHMRLNQR